MGWTNGTIRTDGDVMLAPSMQHKAAVESTSVGLMTFCEWYQDVHGYLSIIACTFGIVSNLMNIVVLTRGAMKTSTNYILTALAITDLMTMSSYLPYAVYFYCITAPDPSYLHGFGWVVFLLFHHNFIITTHTAALWLTVLLALFRYIVVCHHTLGPRLCSLRRAKLGIVLVITSTLCCCSMHYVIYQPVAYNETSVDRQSSNDVYWIDENAFVPQNFKTFTFWFYGVVLKVVPCTLLAILSSLLVRAMRTRIQRRRSSLGLSLRSRSTHRRSSTRVPTSDKEPGHRTTSMLVLVILLLVVTELPQGILAFLSGINPWIFKNVYVPLGDVFDMLVIVNSSVNFILYCTMSARFRTTFWNVFIVGCCKLSKLREVDRTYGSRRLSQLSSNE